MKTSQAFIVFAAFALLATQSGCSAKSSGSNRSDGGGNQQNNVVDVSGTWQSNCRSQQGGVYVQEKFVINGSTYEQNTFLFKDANCTETLDIQVSPISGDFIVEGASEVLSGAVNLKMTYDFNGEKTTGYALALLDGDVMYMSNYFGNNPESRPSDVDRTVSYKKIVATPTPTPAPNPTPAPGVPSELIGTWNGTCRTWTDSSERRVLTITATNFTDANIYYSDKTCTTPNGSSSTQARGPLVFEGMDASDASLYDVNVVTSFAGQEEPLYNVLKVVNGRLYIGPYWSSAVNLRPTMIVASNPFDK